MARRGHQVLAGADGHYPAELVPVTAAPVIAVQFHLLWEARTFKVLLGAVSLHFNQQQMTGNQNTCRYEDRKAH
jgi:hypothetical protein